MVDKAVKRCFILKLDNLETEIKVILLKNESNGDTDVSVCNSDEIISFNLYGLYSSEYFKEIDCNDCE